MNYYNPEDEYTDKIWDISILDKRNKYKWEEGEDAYIFSGRYNMVVKVLLLEKIDEYFWKVGIMRYPTLGYIMNKEKSGPSKPPLIEPFIVSEKELRPSLEDACNVYADIMRKRMICISREFLDKLDAQRVDYLQAVPSQPGPKNSVAQHEMRKHLVELDVPDGTIKASGSITVNGHDWTTPNSGQGISPDTPAETSELDGEQPR